MREQDLPRAVLTEAGSREFGRMRLGRRHFSPRFEVIYAVDAPLGVAFIYVHAKRRERRRRRSRERYIKRPTAAGIGADSRRLAADWSTVHRAGLSTGKGGEIEDVHSRHAFTTAGTS